MQKDKIDFFESNRNFLGDTKCFSGAPSLETLCNCVIVEIVVADFGDVDISFEIELGYFEEEGKGLDFGDDRPVNLLRIFLKVLSSEAEFFEQRNGFFRFEREALFFRTGECYYIEIGIWGQLIEEKSLDDQIGVSADGARKVAIAF